VVQSDPFVQVTLTINSFLCEDHPNLTMVDLCEKKKERRKERKKERKKKKCLK
jgi:hypothetical protein